MAETITEMVELDTLGVSLVTRGANKKRFALTKSETTMTKQQQMLAAFKAQIEKGELPDEATVEKVCAGLGLEEKQTEGVKAMLRIRAAFADVEKLDAAIAEVLGAAGGDVTAPEGDRVQAENEEEKPEPEVEEKQDDDNGEDNKNTADVEGDDADDESEDEEEDEDMADKDNSMKDTVAKAEERIAALEAVLKSQTDKMAAAEKRAAELDAALAAAREKADTAEWTAKCEQLIVPGTTVAEHVATMKQLSAVDPALAQKHYESLLAVTATVKKSALLRDAGTRSGGQNDGALGRIEAAASKTQVAKSADDKSLFFGGSLRAAIAKAAAVTEAMAADKTLYSAWLEENPPQKR